MSVALRIRSHKSVAIIFFTSLLIIVFTMKSTYSKQSCQNIQTSIQIIDESGGTRLSGTSVATLEDSPFKNYVTTISKHISAKIDKIAQCYGNLKSSPEVKLFFVYRQLVASTSAPIEAPFNLERTQSNGIRHLESPWVKLTFSRSPMLVVRAVFIWNERQFLLDQALMSGIRAPPNHSLIPIDDRIFRQFVQDYTDSVLLAPSPETRLATQASISKRLPPEILWLFRHAWQTTRGPFSMIVASALRSTIEQAASGYTDLTKILVDQFFASEKTEIRYESVLDLKDLFTLYHYQVNQLY